MSAQARFAHRCRRLGAVNWLPWIPSKQSSIPAEITVSEAENLVYIRKVGGVGFDGLESLEDMRKNWNHLLDAAGLTPGERREAVRLFNSKVEKVPGTEN